MGRLPPLRCADAAAQCAARPSRVARGRHEGGGQGCVWPRRRCVWGPTAVRSGAEGGAFADHPKKTFVITKRRSSSRKISQVGSPTRGKVSPGRPIDVHRGFKAVSPWMSRTAGGRSGHPRALSRGTNAPSNAPSRWPAQKRRAEHAARLTRIVALDGTTATGPPVSMANWEHKSRETTENECTPTPTMKHTPCTASRERVGFV